jgi:hypothetical protein
MKTKQADKRVNDARPPSCSHQDLERIAQSHSLVSDEWETVVEAIPVDLERSAQETKAHQRRREIECAKDLLRLVLAYCVCDWPLRLVGLWAYLSGIGSLSDVAVMKRLHKAETWLKHLIQGMLIARRMRLEAAHPVRVHIPDGSSITGPGTRGTDYRLHLSLDLGSQYIDGISVTDVHGAETLTRYASRPDDIWIADRGYAHREGIGSILTDEGHIVVRLMWTCPLERPDGEPLALFPWLRALPDCIPGETQVAITARQGQFSLRLVAHRLPLQAAERARRRVRQIASRKGRTPKKRSLEAAGYLFVVTSLPAQQWTAQDILDLYRLRWQVELLFKRLKSLLDLDHLRTKGSALAQTYLLGKVLTALIIDTMSNEAAQRYPTLFDPIKRPVSPWRWTALCHDILHSAIRGPISWQRLLDKLPDFERYLCITRRHDRPYQVRVAKNLLRRLLGPQAVGPPSLS